MAIPPRSLARPRLRPRVVRSLSRSRLPGLITALLLFLLFLSLFAASPAAGHDGDSTAKEPAANQIIDFPYNNRECHALLGSELGGSKPAFISYELGPVDVSVESASKEALQIAYIIYDFRDQDSIGIGKEGTSSFRIICGDEEQDEYCKKGHGGFVVANDKDRKMNYKYLTETITLSSSAPVKRELSGLSTGYYCFSWVPSALLRDVAIPARRIVHSATGALPAEIYPKLQLLLVTLIIYSVLLFMWSCKLFMYWREILPVQKYITGVFALVVVSNALDLQYSTSWNSTGEQSWLLLTISAIAGSARIAMSFFLLLIICMGYSIVRPSLGEQMRKCQLMTMSLFATLAVYSVMVLKKAEWSGFLVLTILVPLWFLMTAFYTMILSSLAETRQYLVARRQHFKTQMYRKLWYVIMYAVVNFILFFFVTMCWYIAYRNMSFRAGIWQYQWLLTDGWMHVLYGTCFLTLCYLWRPTKNNIHYGLEEVMSDPLEDEFDMDKNMMPTFTRPSANAPENFPLVEHSNALPMGSPVSAQARRSGAPVFTLDAGDDDDNDYNNNIGNTGNEGRVGAREDNVFANNAGTSSNLHGEPMLINRQSRSPSRNV